MQSIPVVSPEGESSMKVAGFQSAAQAKTIATPRHTHAKYSTDDHFIR